MDIKQELINIESLGSTEKTAAIYSLTDKMLEVLTYGEICDLLAAMLEGMMAEVKSIKNSNKSEQNNRFIRYSIDLIENITGARRSMDAGADFDFKSFVINNLRFMSSHISNFKQIKKNGAVSVTRPSKIKPI